MERHLITFFLYHAVINSIAGQFSVSQFLTEIRTTTFIRFWLMEWCRMGAPKEIVTDASRALLTAVIKEFTSYPTIERYADGCRNMVPVCYIRIDVVHFIKIFRCLKIFKISSYILSCGYGTDCTVPSIRRCEKNFKST